MINKVRFLAKTNGKDKHMYHHNMPSQHNIFVFLFKHVLQTIVACHALQAKQEFRHSKETVGSVSASVNNVSYVLMDEDHDTQLYLDQHVQTVHAAQYVKPAHQTHHL